MLSLRLRVPVGRKSHLGGVEKHVTGYKMAVVAFVGSASWQDLSMNASRKS